MSRLRERAEALQLQLLSSKNVVLSKMIKFLFSAKAILLVRVTGTYLINSN